MMPTACGADIHPDTNPRWPTGTWSEMVAVSAAVMMQKPTDAATHAAPIAQISVCSPSTTSESAKTSAPTTIHGRRRPNREAVRSESAPVSG